MRSIHATMLAAALVAIAAATPVSAQSTYTGPVEDRSKICMMQDTVQSREGLEHKYDGKSYFLCCSMCQGKFDENPAKFSTATDPVSGKKVDKSTSPIYAYQGKAFFFESKSNLDKFAANPTQFASAAAP